MLYTEFKGNLGKLKKNFYSYNINMQEKYKHIWELTLRRRLHERCSISRLQHELNNFAYRLYRMGLDI